MSAVVSSCCAIGRTISRRWLTLPACGCIHASRLPSPMLRPSAGICGHLFLMHTSLHLEGALTSDDWY
jgi:hypothetical protein